MAILVGLLGIGLIICKFNKKAKNLINEMYYESDRPLVLHGYSCPATKKKGKR